MLLESGMRNKRNNSNSNINNGNNNNGNGVLKVELRGLCRAVVAEAVIAANFGVDLIPDTNDNNNNNGSNNNSGSNNSNSDVDRDGKIEGQEEEEVSALNVNVIPLFVEGDSSKSKSLEKEATTEVEKEVVTKVEVEVNVEKKKRMTSGEQSKLVVAVEVLLNKVVKEVESDAEVWDILAEFLKAFGLVEKVQDCRQKQVSILVFLSSSLSLFFYIHHISTIVCVCQTTPHPLIECFFILLF